MIAHSSKISYTHLDKIPIFSKHGAINSTLAKEKSPKHSNNNSNCFNFETKTKDIAHLLKTKMMHGEYGQPTSKVGKSVPKLS